MRTTDAAAPSGAVSVSASHAHSLHGHLVDKNGRNLGLLTFMNVLHNKLTKRRIFVSADLVLQALRSWHSTC